MARKPEGGGLFKRWRGKYYPAKSAVPGVYYLCRTVDGKRTFLCLHTRDHEEATKRKYEQAGAIALSDRETYLRSLIELGDRARQELHQHIHNPGSTPIKDVWESFMQSRRRPASGESTLRGYRTAWRSFEKWCPARVKRMRDLTPVLAEDYVTQLERGNVKARTINAHLQGLRLIWKCLDPAYPSPWTALRTTKRQKTTHYRSLTTEEIKRLVKGSKGEYTGLLLLGYTSGMRLKDACLMPWDRIDMENKYVSFKPHKTIASSKMVHAPILPDLMKWLLRIPESKRTGYVLPETAWQYKTDRTKINKALIALFHTADVWDTDEGKASFHSLRATWQTRNDEAGTSRVVARAVLGHSSSVMSDTYSKLDVLTARKQIEKAMPNVT